MRLRGNFTSLIAVALLCAAVAALVAEGLPSDSGERGSPSGPERGARTALVTRVVDGDTIEVRIDGRTEDVRYIGIDTPESVAPGRPVECFGEEASALNRRLVEGKRVRLVPGVERRDRYGRLLAYVYQGDLFVNAELVRRGFARTLEIEPNTRFADLLAGLERRAAAAGRGLWAAC